MKSVVAHELTLARGDVRQGRIGRLEVTHPELPGPEGGRPGGIMTQPEKEEK